MSDPPDRYSAAIESNHLALYRYWCERIPGSYLREDDAVFIAITGIAHPLGNAVLRTRWDASLAPEAIRERIAATLEPFKARRVPLIWYVWPWSRPADLGRSLEAAGPADAGSSPAMALDLATWSDETSGPPGLRIERVHDAATRERWSDVASAGSGFSQQGAEAVRPLARVAGYGDPLRHYLGWLDEEPVATTALFVADGIAGIFGVATLPPVRRRGIGAALTVAALRDPRGLGCHTAILTSSRMGEGVYRQLGFVERCRVGEYIWRSEATTA
jgi:GNAT superfamily N-acetyltransferase